MGSGEKNEASIDLNMQSALPLNGISARSYSFPRNVLNWLLGTGGELRERVLRSGIWLLVQSGITRLAGLLKIAILSRLISPHDFGLLGIAMLVVKWVEYFTETGIAPGLIQKRGDVRPYLNTAWTAHILRSTGVAILLIIAAPFGARYFGHPQATTLIRTLGLMSFIWGFTNPAVIFLRKELDCRSEAIWRLSGVLAGVAVAIPAAFLLRNVWALVLSLFAAQVVETATSFWIIRYWPHFEIDWSRLRELLHFGRWIFWLNVTTFIEMYGDSAFVGKLLGTTALGFYQMAAQLSLMATSQLAGHIETVMFPAFTKLDDNKNAERAFLKLLGLISSIALPVGVMVTVYSGPLVTFLLGARWLPIAPALQVLIWAGVCTALASATRSFFMAVGQPNLAVRASFVKIVCMGLLIYPLLTRAGIAGTALAITIGALASTGYQFYVVSRFLTPTLQQYTATFRAGVTACIPLMLLGFTPLRQSKVFFFVTAFGLSAYLIARMLRFKSQMLSS